MKRLVALALALLLLCGTVFAASFPDIEKHWSAEYVEDMYAQKLVKGYSDGEFKPENKVTNLEALVFVSRLCTTDAATLTAAEALYSDYLKALLPTSSTWATGELSVCLASGIISKAELTALKSSLNSSAIKQQLAIWFVRALRLEPSAALGTSAALTFADTSDISEAARPYVYQLTSTGIIEGTEKNTFLPKSEVTRAVMATMLSRAVKYLDRYDVEIELNELTSYDFAFGKIASISAADSTYAIAITDLLGQTKKILAPAATAVYKNSMLADSTALQVGAYLRVCYNKNGAVDALKVTTLTQAVSGTLTSADKTSVVTSAGTFTVDRFTRVLAGSTLGGSELLASTAGYNYVSGITDGTGRLLTLTLSGGSTSVQGVVKIINGRVFITGTDGVSRAYDTSLTTVTTLNGTATTLGSAYNNCYATATVSNDSGKLTTLAASNTTTMVQASFRATATASGKTSITAYELYTGNSLSYSLASDCTVVIKGESSTLSRLANGYFMTLTLNASGVVTAITAVEGTRSVTGTVSSLSLGSPIVLEVKTTSGVEAFPINVSKLPTVKSGTTVTTIDKIASGDTVTVTTKSGSVSDITVAENVTTAAGTVKSITIEAGGTMVYLADASGETASYALADGCTVKYGTSTIALNDIIGGTVSLTLKGGKISAIVLTAYANAGTDGEPTAAQLEGTYVFINKDENYFLVQSATGELSTVNVNTATKYIGVNGANYYLTTVPLLSTVSVYGSYTGSTLTATLVIVK